MKYLKSDSKIMKTSIMNNITTNRKHEQTVQIIKSINGLDKTSTELKNLLKLTIDPRINDIGKLPNNVLIKEYSAMCSMRYCTLSKINTSRRKILISIFEKMNNTASKHLTSNHAFQSLMEIGLELHDIHQLISDLNLEPKLTQIAVQIKFFKECTNLAQLSSALAETKKDYPCIGTSFANYSVGSIKKTLETAIKKLKNKIVLHDLKSIDLKDVLQKDLKSFLNDKTQNIEKSINAQLKDIEFTSLNVVTHGIDKIIKQENKKIEIKMNEIADFEFKKWWDNNKDNFDEDFKKNYTLKIERCMQQYKKDSLVVDELEKEWNKDKTIVYYGEALINITKNTITDENILGIINDRILKLKSDKLLGKKITQLNNSEHIAEN